MKIENIFYIVGVIFIFATVIYFVKNYIADLSDIVKLTLLIIATILAFILGDYLRRLDK